MCENLRMVFAVLLVGLMIGVGGGHVVGAGPNDVDSLLARAGAKAGGETVVWMPFRFSVNPRDLPKGGGNASVGITVIPGYDCGVVRLETEHVDNLEFLAITPASVSAGANESVFVEVQVNIPKNDTSGVVIRAVGTNGWSARVPVYFVSTTDSVQCHVAFRGQLDRTFYADPRGHSGIPDSVFWEEKNPKGPRLVRTGQFDMDGNFVPQDSVENGVSFDGRRVGSFDSAGNFIATDSILRVAAIQRESRRLSDSVLSLPGGPKEWKIVVDSEGNQFIVSRQYYIDSSQAYLQHLYDSVKAAEVQAKIAEMGEMEKTPLTDLDGQTIVVGGKTYHRNKGEYKFSEAIQVYDRAAPFVAKRDSLLWRDNPGGPWDCLLDLRDPKDYELSRTLVDSLAETSGRGIYRATLSLEQRLKLEEAGIRIQPAPSRAKARSTRTPADTTISPAETSENDFDSDYQPSPKSAGVFYEGFEGDFPGSVWDVYDDEPAEGDDYWGKVTCRASSGTYSAWCSAVGFMPHCEFYDYFMRATMDMIQGVDISNYENVKFVFKIWSDLTPSTSDVCVFYISPSSSSAEPWTQVGYVDNNIGDWGTAVYGVPDEWDSVFVSFLFLSFDESDQEDGVFIDNVQIVGDPLPTPNLTYGTPSGWFGPIVPSSVAGTHTPNTLYTGQPTYFDYGIRNIGSLGSGLFGFTVYIDDVFAHTGGSFGIPVGSFDLTLVDLVDNIYGAGDHVVKLHINPDFFEEESNYNDNIFVDTFSWIDPPVQLPNLSPTVPAGWPSSIVSSVHCCSHLNDALWDNQPTYFDYAIKNTGNTQSGAFSLRLTIDGNVFDTVCLGLQPGITFVVEDVQADVPAGTKKVKFEIDRMHQVQEISEEDNSDSVWIQVQPASVTVKGEAWYQELDGSGFQRWHEAAEMRIELWDADADSGDLLDTARTLLNGEFEFLPVSNTEEDGSRQDVYLRLYPENLQAQVSDAIDASYALVPFCVKSDTVLNAFSGTQLWSSPHPTFDVDTGRSGFFYLVDVLRDRTEQWNSLAPAFPIGVSRALLRRSAPGAGYGTQYLDAVDLLLFEASSVDSLGYPDTWDEDVITHEFGHRIEFTHGFFDNNSGPQQHSLDTKYSPEFAAREGFSQFCEGYFKGDSITFNSFHDFKDTVWYNYENATWGRQGAFDSTYGTANAMGDSCEGSIAGVLWDIFDDNIDDFSSRVNWGRKLDTLPNPDGIEDSLSDGIDHILSALLDRNVNGHHPDNITEFWEAWFQAPSFGHVQAMRDIYYEHGIDCCVGIRGNVSGDPYETIDIADVTTLVAYAVKGGAVPPCLEEANVNGVGGIDIADVTYLIAYAFRGGAAPPACP